MDQNTFRTFIKGLLRLSGISKKYLGTLTDDKSLEIYQQAFTHPSVDPLSNYEWWEILGDSTLNKAIVWYVSRRFPILQNPEGVKVIARLKINMVSKKKFAEIAEQLGMKPFIRINYDTVSAQNSVLMRSISEDVLEAFFGATEWIIDTRIEPGAGYGICYLILKKILDATDISLDYNDLYDAITRLKETMDAHRSRFPGTIRYVRIDRPPPSIPEGEGGGWNPPLQHVQVLYNGHGAVGSLLLGEAQGRTLDDAKQVAAQKAIHFLEHRGISKPIPAYYLKIREWLMVNNNNGKGGIDKNDKNNERPVSESRSMRTPGLHSH